MLAENCEDSAGTRGRKVLDGANTLVVGVDAMIRRVPKALNIINDEWGRL